MKDYLVGRKVGRRVLMILLVMAVALAFSLSLARSNVYAAAENPTEAESLTFGKDVAGTFPAYPDEVFNYHYHYYKFKTASYGGVDYTLRAAFTKGGGGNPGFSIYLLNEDYKQIDEEGAENSHCILLSGVGTANSETYKNLKPNTTYYIEVESWYTNNDYTSSYSLRVSKKILKPAAPKLKSVKPGKKKFTVKYSKTKYTTKYQLQLKKGDGSWKTYNNGTKLKKVFKKLKKGKKYSVRVRAARKVDGKWYYGKWSKKKTVKVK